MSPFLTGGRRLALSVSASVPLGVAATALLVQGRSGLPLTAAAFLAFPLSLAVLLLALPVWHLCRALPAHETSATRLLLTHAGGAILMGVAAQYLGGALARVIDSLWAGPNVYAAYSGRSGQVVAAGAILYVLDVLLYYVLLGAEATRRAERRSLELSILAREAELRALRAQIHPHFLFNSLNSISALVSTDPAQAREMCVLLAEFFRRTLAIGEKPDVTLEEELAVARTYLAIERLRLGTRLCVDERIDDAALGCRLPPLLLQPLVENAVRHGIASRSDGGVLRIEARVDGTRLRIGVENPFDPDAPRRPGVGVGLTNVRRRLLAAYADRARVETEHDDECFRVAISLPAEAAA